uniref:Uncharacterized protein n=1 Tax=Takifugu rubripes TaxID=31033 RepID=A0A674PRD6_TAKRU
NFSGTVVAVVGGAVATVALAPVALGAAGFTSAGIAAGSVAAKMMSAAAVANGGGVAAGSAVAVLQSAGKYLLITLSFPNQSRKFPHKIKAKCVVLFQVWPVCRRQPMWPWLVLVRHWGSWGDCVEKKKNLVDQIFT